MKKILYFLLLILLSVITVNAESIFKPVNYYGDFDLDYNYIITAYDKEENSWYALSPYNEKNAVKIENPSKGITLTDKEVKASEYVLKCSKKEAYNKIKLRSNLVDEESGKKYSLYLNKDQVFNLGGGTITLYISLKDETGLTPVYMGRNNATVLTFDEKTNTFGYKELKSLGSGTKVYIFSDIDTLISSNDKVKLNKITTAGELAASFSDIKRYEKFLLVYTDSNGKKYILTDNGAKEITISNNDYIETDDYLYFIDAYSGQEDNGAALLYNNKIAYKGKYLSLDSFYNENITFSEEPTTTTISINYQYNYFDYSNTYPVLRGNWYNPTKKEIYDDLSGKGLALSDEDAYMKYHDEFKFKITNSSSNYYWGWDNENNDFIIVNSEDKGIFFDVYTSRELYEPKYVEYYDKDGKLLSDGYYTGGGFTPFYYGYTASNIPKVYANDSDTEKFVGWSSNPNYAGYIDSVDVENLFTYSKKKQSNTVNESVIKKYSLIEKFSDTEIKDEKVKLYWVGYKQPELTREPYIGKVEEENIIGAIDWKNIQENKTEEELNNKEKNQGSIFIEVYLDGEIFIPASKMYFRYDNDNTTDVTIKFLNNEIDDIKSYLLDQENYYKNSHYNIVGIYAEQGGSEEGLYKKFNWVKDSGAQLDNVKGGSTVKIYLSSKYTLKYYLDDKLYEEDEFVYFPTITKNTIRNNSKNSNYVVNATTNEDLLNITDTTEYFKEENMDRGEYFSFSYELLDLRELVEISSLPNIKLTKDFWIIKDVNGKLKYKALPQELMQHEKTKNIDYIFIEETDEINTIHLYAFTPGNEPEISEGLIKISYPKEVENPETFDSLALCILVLSLSTLGLVVFIKKFKTLY